MTDVPAEITPIDIGKLVSDEYDADVIFYSGGIEDEGFGQIVETVLASRKRDNIVLMLTTNGGSANAAYQIARFLQKVYKKFYLYAPSYCKSAGTIVALGAHELIMDPFSELGPLDVQLLKHNELGTRKSGLLTRSAFEGLSDSSFDLFENFMLRIMQKSGGLVGFRLAAELSSSMTSAMMAGVFAKIDPDVVGGDKRDLEVALHYGMRLIEKSENASISAVFHLVQHYPSHDFIIDDVEAKDLFHNVNFPTANLMKLAGLLGNKAYDESSDIYVVSLSDDVADISEEQDDDQRTEGPAGHELGTTGTPDTGGRGSDDRQGDPEPKDAPIARSGADDGAASATAPDRPARGVRKPAA